MALEVDSEEDSTEPKSPLSPLSSDAEKSEDKRETFHPSPDLTYTRSQSASSACEPATKVKHHLRLSHTFIKHFCLYHKSYVFIFPPLSRSRVTRGFDCVHIPTLLPKSACVLLVLLATTIPQTSALVGNAGTVSFFK